MIDLAHSILIIVTLCFSLIAVSLNFINLAHSIVGIIKIRREL